MLLIVGISGSIGVGAITSTYVDLTTLELFLSLLDVTVTLQ